MIDYGLKGSIVLITGGASGIGRATALLAATDGAAVVIADLGQAAAMQTRREIEAIGARAYAVSFDVRSQTETREAVRQVEAEFGPIDGAVVCAGVPGAMYAEDLSAEAWRFVLDTNLDGAFYTAQAVGRHMISRRRGSIVTIGSTDALGGHTARAHYASSKHAIIGLTRTLAIEWGQYGVRVNCVSPGAVDTALLRRNAAPDAIENVMIDRTPAGRLCRAEEPAKVALFLLSEAASFVSGANIPVDHGLTAGYLTRLRGADTGANALQNRIAAAG